MRSMSWVTADIFTYILYILPQLILNYSVQSFLRCQNGYSLVAQDNRNTTLHVICFFVC